MEKISEKAKIILFFASSLILASVITLSELAGLVGVGLIALAMASDANFRKLF